MMANENSPSSDGHSDPMAEFYQLQRLLYIIMVLCTAVAIPAVWYFYGLNTTLSYLLGAIGGSVYLRTLASDVAAMGADGPAARMGIKGIGIFILLILVATQTSQLQVLPVFLGFLTYKVAIIIYTFKLTL
ncbi:MAG: ATP synthase subunit I, partial [Synechococcaceae cyanobacterium RL_1_2]|nr:ATP synthase subunit I [Synechococcaceae cyanobacterium RL_1_2]